MEPKSKTLIVAEWVVTHWKWFVPTALAIAAIVTHLVKPGGVEWLLTNADWIGTSAATIFGFVLYAHERVKTGQPIGDPPVLTLVPPEDPPLAPTPGPPAA